MRSRRETHTLIGSSLLVLAIGCAGGDDSLTQARQPVTAGASVQRGTAVSNASGTTSVTISSIDPAKSFLLLSTRHSSANPGGAQIRGKIASPTSLQFVRASSDTTPIHIQWNVVTYGSGVRVQRGEIGQSATTLNVAISPVASLSQAFVTFSKTPSASDLTFGRSHGVVAELTSTSNLQLRSGAANSSHMIAWEVIEFTAAADIKVQKGSSDLLGVISRSIPLPTPVDLSKSFVLVSSRLSGSCHLIGECLVQAGLTGSQALEINRSVNSGFAHPTEVFWQVVELRDGSSVQSGNTALTNGAATAVAGLSPVNLSRTAPMASGQLGAGQSSGRSTHAIFGSDIPGVGSATFDLTASQVSLTRAQTSGATNISWFVVQFGSGASGQEPCGDGIVSAPEQCDGGACCTPSCTFANAGFACRAASGACDMEETCSGNSGSCPTDAFRPLATQCRAAAGACDLAEACTGSSSSCPSDSFAAFGTTCRAASSACDALESCTGSSSVCPADGKQASGTVCRAASSACDQAETCDGLSLTCPTDVLLPNGASCRPNTANDCETGQCNGGSCGATGFVAEGSPCVTAPTCTSQNAKCNRRGWCVGHGG